MSQGADEGGTPNGGGSGSGMAATVRVVDISEELGNIRLGVSDIESLAKSISERSLLQRPVVRFHPDYVKGRDRRKKEPDPSDPEAHYQLVAGFRRMAAIRRLGWEEVGVEIKDTFASRTDLHIAQLEENLRRQTLSPIEAALGMKQLVESDRLSKKKVAENLEVSQSEVTKHMNLLNLDQQVQMKVHGGEIGRSQAEVLYKNLKDDSEAQRSFAERAASEDLDYRTLERYIQESFAEDEEPADLVEERIPSLDPTPTKVFRYADGVVPPEGEEHTADEAQQNRMYGDALFALTCCAGDHDMLARELGLPTPTTLEARQQIMDFVDSLTLGQKQTLLMRYGRRYMEAGHRATMTPPRHAQAYMVMESTDEKVETLHNAYLAGTLPNALLHDDGTIEQPEWPEPQNPPEDDNAEDDDPG